MTAQHPAQDVSWQAVSDRLRPFVRSRVGDSDADDVMQEVLLRVHRGLPRLPADARVEAWLFRVARNCVIDHLRSRGRGGLPVALEAATSDEALVTPAPTFYDADAPGRGLAQVVGVFIDRLDAPYAQALRWTELEGLSQREAAERAGISLSGMKSRVQRGRGKLRQALEDCCAIALDQRGKVVDVTPKIDGCHC